MKHLTNNQQAGSASLIAWLDGVFLNRKSSWLLAALLAILGMNWACPDNLDADTTLQALISTQKVTLFYWGQDRFLNFFPFILSWISRVRLNLFAHMLVMGASYFLLLEAIAWSVATLKGKSAPSSYRYVLFAALVVVSVLLLGRSGLYVFAYAAQPYASSFLFMAWSFTSSGEKENKPLGWGVASVLTLIAVGLNPSIFLAYGAVCLFLLIFHTKGRALVMGVLALGSFLFWRKMSQAAQFHGNDAYSTFSWRAIPNGMSGLWTSYQTNVGFAWLFVGLLAIAALSLLKTHRSDLPTAYKVAAWFLAGFAVSWILLFSSNQWIGMNAYHFRYFFPAILIALTFIAIRVADFVVCLDKPTPATLATSALLAVVILVAHAPVHLSQYRYFNTYLSIAKFGQSHGVRLLAGDYWSVWNVTFAMNSISGNQLESKVYGVAYRGEAMRPEIEGLIHSSLGSDAPELRALCLGSDMSECREQLSQRTGYRWKLAETSDCFIKCGLYIVENDADHPSERSAAEPGA